jgi:neurotransmitter:Na+ symporter, NSS family
MSGSEQAQSAVRTTHKREAWATRIGLVLAMAGNAIGLGNFLRFPVQAAKNGGGAFMIPYVCALLFLGIPLMWAEWAIGRHGGTRGHGTTPGMFDGLTRSPVAKYLGALGIVLPLGITIYYVFIESWTLAYSYFSATSAFGGVTSQAEMESFLHSFQGLEQSPYFGSLATAYVFFLLTMATNAYVLWHGIAGGIEKLAKIAMPVLFLFGIIIVVRVFTLDVPDPTHPERSVINGLAFVWEPDFRQLTNARVWLAAAGQIMFTLSIACGAIHTYASYLKAKDDVVVTGFATATTNELAEVILGGSIAIPVTFAFFGYAAVVSIAQKGSFNLGFVAMPVIFQNLPGGMFFGTLWFLLLFFAGITSSVALSQPAIAFLQDELGWTRKRAVSAVVAFIFVAAHVPILGLGAGALDEMDFWCGTLGLAVFALIESVLFFWVFGMNRAWAEIELGAQVKVPRIFRYVMLVITPIYLLALFIAWAVQDGPAVVRMDGVSGTDALWRWAARALIVGMAVICCWLIFRVWRPRAVAAQTVRVPNP